MKQHIHLVILVILTTFALSFGAATVDGSMNEPAFTSLRQQHRRVRRMTGYRKKCLPQKKKLCSIFTHEGVSKTFCFYVNIRVCTGLDK